MQSLANSRKTTLEKFYTPDNVARSLVSTVTELVPDWRTRTWLEPCAGGGSFLRAATIAGVQRIVALDVEPAAPGIEEKDFLVCGAGENIRDTIVLTNPPFGRCNSLSVKFFNKAADHAEFICFIVPKSWRKWSVTNRLDKRFHLIHDIELKVNYVDASDAPISGKSVLSTVFQVWQRRDQHRSRVTVENRGYVKKCKPAEADVALTVFGWSCGRVETDFERKPNTTKMFLKTESATVVEALRSVNFSRFSKNVAYVSALGMQEVNFLLNEWFDACNMNSDMYSSYNNAVGNR